MDTVRGLLHLAVHTKLFQRYSIPSDLPLNLRRNSGDRVPCHQRKPHSKAWHGEIPPLCGGNIHGSGYP